MDASQNSPEQHPDAVYRPFGEGRPFNSATSRGFQDPLPPAHSGSVYHYTGADGIHGILTKGCVFASHAITMNDPLEGRYGWRIISERYGERLARGDDRFESEFRQMFNGTEEWSSWETPAFVLSGTSLASDLNQYRLYGMYQVELEGGTWALRKDPEPRDTWRTPLAQWRPVLYGREQALPYVDRMIDWATAIMASVDPTDFEDTGLVAALAVQVLALHIKDVSYAHEHELRLVFGVESSEWRDWVDVRPRGSGRLVPFLRAVTGSDQDGFVRSVELGPTVQGQANVDAVKHLHQVRYPHSRYAALMDGLAVTESEAHYRE
ncbi:MAG: hypothetical protein WAV45_04930 [Propionibacteriaceae bacterium]